MRNVLGTSVPKVFSWSSMADNAVGAEYILMENVRGVQLSQIWNRLDVKLQFEIVRKVALYQDSWAQTHFSQYGSLYYKQDLGHLTPSLRYTGRDGQHVVHDRFAVGPSISRQNIDDGRIEFDFDRGPWHTAEDYERASGLRESYCIRNTPQLPRSPIAIHYSGTYRPSREKKLLAAESYLKLVKYLTLDNESIRTSHIWHDDLHTENIFVNPDDPSEIYCFIDWQSTELAPLYFMHKKSMRLFKTLEYQQTLCFQLLLFARNLLLDGEATYLAILADQQQENWAGIPKISHCNEGPPLSFSKAMLEEIERDNEDATASIMPMQEAKQTIGKQHFKVRGVVSHEEFAKAREIIPRVKEEFVRKYARDNEEPTVTLKMHSWSDRPLRDGKDADEWKPTSASEAAANIDEWYQAGRLLFPRDSLQDVHDQLRKPLKKGDSIYVKAFDGLVYEYPVRTGDTKTLFERDGDKEEDKPVLWVIVSIGHWMTRVDQEPEPETAGNLDSGVEYLRTNLRDWEGSGAWKDIRCTLSSLNLSCKIAKVIGMACGTFTPTLESRGCRRSAVQHAFLLTLKSFLQESNLGTREVACYAQDPGYSKTYELVLEKSNIKVLEDPEGFLGMDDVSLVFSCGPNICVKEIVADIARPLVLIWCTVEEEDPKNPQYVFSRPW
ncbi:hypothetical protein CNMCM5793_008723 [Aspergillus hiratsukae]|uniref:Altered inheritance of mitochondria protein 9, mitochondrial n=1 Tax=Aspergillus hiratsukae TaxID=1194566 RepID=A0A8H6P1B3_9EURO|nr:hypothetical protein CNMCM5793_008723 [Aspergillus hiratsukae]